MELLAGPILSMWKILIDIAYWNNLAAEVGFTILTYAELEYAGASDTDPSAGPLGPISVATTGAYWDSYSNIVISESDGIYSVTFDDETGSGPGTVVALVASGGSYASTNGRVQIEAITTPPPTPTPLYRTKRKSMCRL